MGDDGVGIHVVHELKRRRLPDHVDVVDGGTAGVGLVDILCGRRRVIAVDAIKAAGDGPQEIRLLSPDNLCDDLVPGEDGGDYSVHDMGLTFAIRLIKVLDMKIPDIAIIGIPAADIRPKTALSEQCSRLVPEAADLVMKMIDRSIHPTRNDTGVIRQ